MLRRSFLAVLAALVPASALAWAPTTAPDKLVPKNPLGLRGPLKIGLRQTDFAVLIDIMLTRPVSSGVRPSFSYVIFRDGRPLYTGLAAESGSTLFYRGVQGGQFYAELYDPLGALVARSSIIDILSEVEGSD